MKSLPEVFIEATSETGRERHGPFTGRGVEVHFIVESCFGSDFPEINCERAQINILI